MLNSSCKFGCNTNVPNLPHALQQVLKLVIHLSPALMLLTKQALPGPAIGKSNVPPSIRQSFRNLFGISHHWVYLRLLGCLQVRRSSEFCCMIWHWWLQRCYNVLNVGERNASLYSAIMILFCTRCRSQEKTRPLAPMMSKKAPGEVPMVLPWNST